jgi:tetratricopeptide (TPR) repeat protein
MNKLITLIFFSILSFQVIAQDEAKIQELYSQGMKHYKNNEFKEAEISFSGLIEIAPFSEGLRRTHIFRGLSRDKMGKYNDAIIDFNIAIDMDSLDPASYTDRGLTYINMKKSDLAIKDFQQVLKIDSTGEQAEAAFYWLGYIYLANWDNQNAIIQFDKFLNIFPNDAGVYFLRGTAKSNLMDIEGSISDYDMAIKYNPNYMEAYANRGFQKVNAIPLKDKMAKGIKCLKKPCSDLLRAKELGDTTVDDMVYLYCKKCK